MYFILSKSDATIGRVCNGSSLTNISHSFLRANSIRLFFKYSSLPSNSIKMKQEYFSTWYKLQSDRLLDVFSKKHSFLFRSFSYWSRFKKTFALFARRTFCSPEYKHQIFPYMSICPFMKSNEDFLSWWVNPHIIALHKNSKYVYWIDSDFRCNGFFILVMPAWIRIEESGGVKYIYW